MKSAAIALRLASVALPAVFFAASFGTLWIGFKLTVAESAHGAFFFGIRSVIPIAFVMGVLITGLSYLAPSKRGWFVALLIVLSGLAAFCGYVMAQSLMYI
jgi:hypothetical protein